MVSRLKKYFLWPLASILVFMILFEGSLTILGIDPHPRGRNFTVNRAPDFPEVFLRDSHLFWRLRPDQTITSEFFEGKTYRINRQGFRGHDFQTSKSGLRVAILGNSCAFGWGVRYRETFAYLIQEQLQAAGQAQARVYNFSVPGYSSFQGKRNYLRNVRAYKPDIVIVTFGWNDHWLAANSIPDNKQQTPPEIIVAINNFLARLRSYRVLKSAIFSIIPEEDLGSNIKLARVSLDDFRENLGDIITFARQDGARVILLTSPIPSLQTYFETGGRSILHENHLIYNDAIREMAAVYSTGLVDLAAIFDRYNNLFDNAGQDPFHYNKLGHDLAAVEIYKFMNRSGLID